MDSNDISDGTIEMHTYAFLSIMNDSVIALPIEIVKKIENSIRQGSTLNNAILEASMTFMDNNSIGLSKGEEIEFFLDGDILGAKLGDEERPTSHLTLVSGYEDDN